MARKQYPLINNFSKGELSPRMEGRTDIQGYYQGCKIMKNCIMVAQGGVEKRPGTIYIGELFKDSEAKLVPFEVSDEDIFILEMGQNYIRIWDVFTNTPIQDSGSDLIFTTGYSASDISEIQYATTEGKIFFAHQNHSVQYLQYKDEVFSWNKMSFQVDGYVSTKSYKAYRSYVFDSGDYWMAIKDTTGNAPATGAWSYSGRLGGTPTADVQEYIPGNFSAGDFCLYDGSLWQAKRDYTGGGSCPPETGISVDEWYDDGYIKTPFIWSYELNCIETNFLKGCAKREDWSTYLHRKYDSSTQRIIIPEIKWHWGDIGRWFNIRRQRVRQVSSESTDTPYWGPALSAVPGGTATTVLKLYVASDGLGNPIPYYKNEVVFDSGNYYKCTEDGTTLAPTEEAYWEKIDKNPFFSYEGDYPAAITYMNQRLFLGGTKSHPQTIYASAVDAIYDFNGGTNDSNSFAFEIAAERSSRIKWMLGKDHLMVGTTSSEWLVLGGANGITPTSVQVLRQSSYGSAYNQAEFVGDTLLFYQRGGRKLREYIYSNDNKSYLANDLTFFADHIVREGVDETSYQQNPDSILWSTKKDGGLVGFTYNRLEGIAGWHRHSTYGEFESIASISANQEEDQLWVIARRTINGVYKRYIEVFAPRFFQDDYVFVDSAKIISAGEVFSVSNITNNTTDITVTVDTITGIADGNSIKLTFTNNENLDYQVFEVSDLVIGTTDSTFKLKRNGNYFTTDTFDPITSAIASIVSKIFTGLDHLIGETVSILGDKSVFPDQTVVSNVDGSGGIGIELSVACNKIVCGFKYDMILQPESIEIPGVVTTGSKHRVSKVLLRLYNSLGGYVGTAFDKLQEIRYRDTYVPFGAPPELFTGIKEVAVDSKSDDVATVIVFHDQPLPMTITAIVSDITYARS